MVRDKSSLKQNNPLTIICTFDETDPKLQERVNSLRRSTLVGMAYRAVCASIKKSVQFPAAPKQSQLSC